MRLARRHCERGFAAGLEGLMFGVLILLGGLTLVLNAWAVIDTQTALDSAAREFIRSYVTQSSHELALDRGTAAARLTLGARGANPDALQVQVIEPNGFGPCSKVTVRLGMTVPSIHAPFLRGFGSMRSTASLTALVGAHRQLVTDPGYSPARTECFDG